MSALLALATLLQIARVLISRDPEPWDAGEVVEGWRAAQGLPVYEDADSGHATLMYGPLMPYVYGLLFRLAGEPGNVLPQLLNLAAAVILVAGLILAARRLRPFPGWMVPVAIALVIAVDIRTEYRFARLRPDTMAQLFALLGLVAIYRAQRLQSLARLALGTALLAIALLFKQTIGLLALIPCVPIFFDRALGWRRRLFWAAAPPLAMVLIVMAIRVLAPQAYHYVITVGAGYRVDPGLFVRSLVDFLLALPLFLALLLHWGTESAPGDEWTVEWQWTLSAVAVTLFAGALSYAKIGGTSNSWSPPLFALTFVALLRFQAIDRWLSDVRLHPLRRIALGGLLALLLLLTYPGFKGNIVLPRPNRDYDAVVARMRALPGLVLAPEEPTMALYAKGTIGRNLHLEYDARPEDGHWPSSMPRAVEREIRSAQFVVDVRNPYIDFFGEVDLQRLGFVQRERHGRYTVWENSGPAGARPATPAR